MGVYFSQYVYIYMYMIISYVTILYIVIVSSYHI